MKYLLKQLTKQNKFISRIAYEQHPTEKNETWVRIYSMINYDLTKMTEVELQNLHNAEELIFEFKMPMVEMREVINGKITNVLRHNITNWDKYI